jgi:hypothetical protein
MAGGVTLDKPEVEVKAQMFKIRFTTEAQRTQRGKAATKSV